MSEPVRAQECSATSVAPKRLRRVLLLGLKKAAIERLVPALRRGAFEVATARTGPSALVACQQRQFDALLVREPISEMALEDFLDGLRAASGASNRAFVQVLAEQERVNELAPLTNERFGISHWADFGSLLAVIAKNVLGVAPRLSERFMAEVNTQLAGGTLSRFCQVENISESGLLIKTKTALPVGERVIMSFSLPGVSQPVRVSGEVVRHTDPAEIEGFAVRFDEFAGVSFRRLRDFLIGS